MDQVIHRIRIVNFQGHRDTELHLSQGINAFRGASRRGKTAIYRALYWWATNRLKGDWFIRHGEKRCRVEVDIGEHTIIRERTPTFNGYIINGEKEKAGNYVPEKIAKLMPSMQVNWQGEHDGPYLLNNTGGEVAKKLNEIADLEDIDISLSNIASWIKRNNSAISHFDSAIEDLESSVEEYDYVDQMQKEFQKIEKLAGEIDDLSNDCFDLSEAVEKLVDIENRLKRAEEIAKGREEFDRIEEIRKEIDEKKDSKVELEELITEIEEIDEKLKEYPSKKALQEADKKFTELKKMSDEMKRKRKEADKLSRAIKNIEKINNQLDDQSKLIQEIKNQLPYKCPTCGSILK